MVFLQFGQLFSMEFHNQERVYDNDLSDLVGKMVKIKKIHRMPVGRRSLNIEGHGDTWDKASFYEHSLAATPLLFVSYKKEPDYQPEKGAYLCKIQLLDDKNVYLFQILPYDWWDLHDYFEIVTE